MTRDKSNNHDDVLNSTPEGDTGLSKQYRQASSEMPPDRLDRTILSHAHRAVKARKHLAFSPFASDWRVPAALAAVLVLCVTLVITVQHESVMPPVDDLVAGSASRVPGKEQVPPASPGPGKNSTTPR